MTLQQNQTLTDYVNIQIDLNSDISICSSDFFSEISHFGVGFFSMEFFCTLRGT